MRNWVVKGDCIKKDSTTLVSKYMFLIVLTINTLVFYPIMEYKLLFPY